MYIRAANLCIYNFLHTYIYMSEQCKWMKFIVPVLKIYKECLLVRGPGKWIKIPLVSWLGLFLFLSYLSGLLVLTNLFSTSSIPEGVINNI